MTAAPLSGRHEADHADEVLAAAVARLAAAGCVAAAEEAAAFVSSAPDAATLEAWLRRREQGEPQPWITGTLVFCGRPLYVAPGVFVPRSQTQDLARRAAAVLPEQGRAVDLCTGTGAIGAHLRAQVPTSHVVGVDVDPRAAACARRNGVPAVAADLAAPLRRPAGGVDVVTAVAPYVPTDELQLLPSDVQRYEPRHALDGGADGLALVRRVVVEASHLLRRDGWLLLEVGADQDRALAPTLAAQGFDVAEAWHDDEGDLRGLAARATGSRAGGGASR